MVKCFSVALAIALSGLAIASEKTNAAVVNGSFEIGTFSDWSAVGQTSIQSNLFGSSPTDGTYQALLETQHDTTNVSGSDLESFLGLLAKRLTDQGAVEGSAIKQTVTANKGDVLTFSWNFLTDDPASDFNDFAFFSLGSLTSLADTNSPLLFTSLTTPFAQSTGYQTYSYQIQAAGTYTLGFGVVDVGDTTVNSALLIDQVRLSPGSTTPVPEPLTILGSATALGVGALLKREHSKRKK